MDTMTRKHGLWIAVTLALAVAVFGGVRTMAQDHDAEVATHDEHDDHDEHAEGEEHDDHDDHAEGETADEHAGHDDHVDIVKLSEAEMAEFGIRLAVA